MTINNFTKYLLGIFMILTGITLSGQQSEIEYNSDTGAAGPQLLIQESGDAGDEDGEDGWARMWFKNTVDPVNRWGFLARPHSGATDNPGDLMSPLVMAYTGVQKFGFGMDGTLRINKQYSLPNMDGTNGQVLTTDGAGNVSWGSGGAGGSFLWTEAQGPRYSNTGSRFARINSTNGGNTGYRFENNGLQEALIWHEVSSGDLIFTNNNGSTRHMVIDGATQNIGIGTSAPAAELHVSGDGIIDGGLSIGGSTPPPGDDLYLYNNSYINMYGGGASYIRTFSGATGGTVETLIGKAGTGDLILESNIDDIIIDAENNLIFNTDDIEKMRIIQSGNVGIGTPTPNEKLHIRGSLSADIRLQANFSNHLRFSKGSLEKGRMGLNGTDMEIVNTETDGDIRIETTDLTQFISGGIQNMAIESDGDITLGRNAVFVDERGIGNDRVGINNTTPSSALHVNHFNSTTTGGFTLQNNSNNNWWKFYTASSADQLQLRNNSSPNVIGYFTPNGLYNASDKRIKKNVEEIPYGVKDIMKLNLLRYNYNSDKEGAKKSIGLFAQELDAVAPELVTYDKDSDQYAVNYAGMSVIAVKAIQEQQEIIEKIIKGNEELKAENAELKNQIASILARLDAEGK